VRTGLLAAFLAAALSATAARAQEVTYSGSFGYASGDYIFTRTIRTFTLHNGLNLRLGSFRLDASLPVIAQNSGTVSVVGGLPIPTGGSSHGAVAGRQGGERIHAGSGRRGPAAGLAADPGPYAQVATDSGIDESTAYRIAVGDPMVSTGLDVYEGTGFVRSLGTRASTKVPLNGLDSGVGTGEWDYGVGATGVVGVGPVIAILDLAWWWYGDLPDLELRDGPSWGAGLALPVSRALWGSVMASGAGRVVETADAPLSLAVGLSRSRPGTGSLSLTAGIGLSETAPDFTLSLGWRRQL
jgi:hypothetical protein